MSSRTKTAGKTAYLLVSLGTLVAIVASTVTLVAAATPARAYGEIISESVETSPVAGTVLPSISATDSTVATPSVLPTVAAAPVIVVVPSVLGATKTIAVRRLHARHLRVKMSRTYSTRKNGTVISQSPYKSHRVVGSTVYIKLARRWPSGFKSKAQSDRFWRPYVVAAYRDVQRNRRYRGHNRVCTSANVNMTLRAIWGESRGNPWAGINHHDSYLGLLQMNKGYGSQPQRLDPIYSIKRMGRGIKINGASWARSRWSTI